MFRKGRFVLAVPLLFVLVLGCGSGRNPNVPASVSGKITYKGQPLKGGTIAFMSKEGAYTGAIRSDGTYDIKDLPVGQMEVTIETESMNPNIKKQTYGKKGGASPMPSSAQEKAAGASDNYVHIPPRFGDRANSKLTATLTTGQQTKDWELKD
jgi:hypothetical protein